ncbi:LPS export ABC transporter periplasmic protein LptC [Lyngbya sp. CCY1209]|uniref:LPS export ABC transporter periplasmic protein LptC n=1 Tax=Lyngbya sp. CCY1209 TaxID=2886103 RepID=UPI002D209DFC|nr:LPS export ABC transporter periplasmic protein LptC [Lyngbya sp. CCY1209]MEB3885488.1 LPS export ABC transporter periplasmic protein LptC [Lyngbya sp. CCY1209]
MARIPHSPCTILLPLALLVAGLAGCRPATPEDVAVEAETETESEEIENTLTLDDVVLEQADEEGQLLWRVRAKQASYSPDNKVATVIEPQGELFADGKLRYQIEGDTGTLHQDGKRLFLRGSIVAEDLENGIVLRGSELEWIVDQEILIARNGVTGEHEKMQAVATEVQVFDADKRVEFWNQVVVNFKESGVQLRSDHIIWRWEEEKFVADRRVELDRFENQTLSDRGVAKAAELDLKAQVATLKDSVQVALSDPPLQVSSDELRWNYEKETLESPKPITVIDRKDQLTFSGDSGWGDLNAEIFHLIGNVLGVGQKQQAQINTDLLTWYVSQQSFKAEGDVIYRQVDPPMTLRGEKATGRFDNQTVVVTGNTPGDRVTTQFVP